MTRDEWRARSESEIAFWRDVFATRGGAFPDEFAFRLAPDSLLQEEIEALLPDKETVRILDVGAGPMTWLGKKGRSHKLQIVAVDPLLPFYDPTHTLTFPNVTRVAAFGEELLDRFDPDSFDLAFSRNALDHAIDPVAILDAMRVLAPRVHIRHAIREGRTQRYEGLHQWDIFPEAGGLVIEGRDGSRTCLEPSGLETRDGWVHATWMR
jgi:hypothetical protein